ncbi:sensor histidine kinase [Burkholderiaceae bacterium FT117]|uniref:sensor histidine kinase n=1 Tax=Zeimonas sediminis TaxID=2944268 RepID=UPI0023431A2F|nr:sensor histidine kinase [Zeimonas sediminis]MCM5570154.1 sensor histidine kinase [Zeimonas sediminis]
MRSLRDRLSLLLALSLVAAVALLATGLQWFPRQLVEGYVLSRLEHDADLLYARVHDAPDPAQAASALEQSAGSVYGLPLSGHYFRAVRGELVLRSRSLWDEDLPAGPAPGSGAPAFRIAGPAGQSLLAIERRYDGAGGSWRILVAEDVGRLDAAIASLRFWLLAGAALATALLLWLQRALIVRGLAPIGDAVEACRKLERGESARIDTEAPTEVRPIIDAVNRLVRHQSQRLARTRHAAGNLSHALKTPLAVLAQAADDAAAEGRAELAATLRAQLDSMRGTIERELSRARLAGGGTPGEGFDAKAQLGALAAAMRRLHSGRELSIDVVAPERRLPIDREDMLELFGNLLDNACKWARSRARVELTLDEAGAALAFRVDDDGPGVAPELLDRLGEAGVRADEARPGHGLGLAIVGDIVAQYGGTIRYERSQALGGLCAAGRLPLGAGDGQAS